MSLLSVFSFAFPDTPAGASINRNRHNRNKRIGLSESPCLEVMNLVLLSLSPRILNRQHAHKQTKELGHDGNGQSTFSGSSRDGRSRSPLISGL